MTVRSGQELAQSNVSVNRRQRSPATMEKHREALIAAVEHAISTYRGQWPPPGLLSSPGKTILEPICAAIRNCPAFEEVAGAVLYSGGAGPVVDVPLFAGTLFGKAEHSGDTNAAVDWLFRVLTTRQAPGLFKAAVWGLSIDTEVTLSATSRLMPFVALPDSHMKSRIAERATPCYDGSAWLAHNYFDVPRVAFVRDVPKFPYIGTDGACFAQINKMQMEVHDIWTIIQSVTVGQPLAIGCWFEYADSDLDLAGWQNSLAWVLPEIHPYVATFAPVRGTTIQENLRRYALLPVDLQSDLLRSMNRFTLSLCRHQIIDRVLDLALAFEIAVSGKAPDQAPPGWKVAVRSAQLIGGPLDARQRNRKQINDLYRLRSRATHGSGMRDRDPDAQLTFVQECSARYQELLQSFLALGAEPNWSALELEPRSR